MPKSDFFSGSDALLALLPPQVETPALLIGPASIPAAPRLVQGITLTRVTLVSGKGALGAWRSCPMMQV
jgi:hypothetical protein